MTRAAIPTALAAGSLILVNCAGGEYRALPHASTGAHATATFVVKVPAAASSNSLRGRKYISPATQSLSINGAGFNVSPAAPGCTAQTGGGVACSFTVDAPQIGSAEFKIATYDQPLDAQGNPQGNELSSADASATINPGVANVVRITLAGVPAHASVSIANLSPPIGTPATLPISLSVQDADGYTIVGPYATDIKIAITNVSGNADNIGITSQQYTNFNYALIASSSDSPVLEYAGHLVQAATVTASIGNNAPFYSAQFVPQPAYGTEMPVDTPLDHAEALRLAGAPWATYWTEPAKHSIAVTVAPPSYVELPTPSGGTPLHLAYDQLPAGVYFTESDNAVGTAYQSQISSGTSFPFLIDDNTLNVPNAGPYAIAAGFSEPPVITLFNAGALGVYSDNAVTEYPTGVANSTPAGLILAAQYEFADPGANAIGFMNSSTHQFTYHYLPTPGAQPTAMTLGPNYDAWFTEPGASKVGTIDQSGNITEYPCGGVPIAIVAQENAVAVLTSVGKIDLYDPSSGAYREYSPPASSSGPVVGLGDGGNGDIILLRSNGSTGAVLDFEYF